MSVSKFRFVSPGVYVNEIDNSQLPRTPEEMGPVVIGRSLYGPMMRPVRVTDAAAFEEIFGKNVPGGKGGDVWRDGNTLTPTYGTYAANAYLRSSSPVTYVRLGGYQYLGDDATSGYAGWETEKAYGLFVAPLSGSGASTKVSGSAPLVAIIYSSGTVGLSGQSLTSSVNDTNNATATWVKVANTNLEVNLVVNNSTASVNFDSNSNRYIRSVLNTTPSQYSIKKYFLGETFATWAAEKLGDLSSQNYAAAILELKDHSDFRKNASDANNDNSGNPLLDKYAGWVVSQHKGAYNEMKPSGSTGIYADVQNLFKFVGLTEGEWNSQNLKITIQDIKLPPYKSIKYGTFTVSIKAISSKDKSAEPPKEVFTNLNLDPSSENYIARRIGDKYTEWDYSKKAFVSYGLYDNQSKFVRVVMNNDVDNALTDASLLPFGYYGPVTLVTGTLSGSTSLALTNGHLSGNTITCASSFTASFEMPQIPNLTNSDSSSAGSFASMNWGFKTEINGFHNQDVVDLVRTKPVNYANLGTSAKVSYLFSLDDLSGSVVNGELDDDTPVTWEEGNRAAGESLTTVTGAFNGIAGLLNNFSSFTMPLVGGFDGLDITKSNPFANSLLENVTEKTSYAYNSVKVAIESISDPEVVEMNLACVPGITNESLTTLLIEKCEARGDALAIIDLEGDYNPEEQDPVDRLPNISATITNLKNRNLNSSYGCTYFPWVSITDPANNAALFVPPSVVALGTFSSAQRSSELWFAPAGFNRGGLSNGSAGYNVRGAAIQLTSKDRDALYEVNINPIATFTAAEGIVIYGQKTLQVTPSALDRINVRRLMIYLKKEISRMASTVLFDPNIRVTWNRFLGQAEPFLSSVKSRFGLSDYRIILDETTTTADLVDRNIVYAKILLKPTRAIEFIALDFVLAPTGASFND